MPSQTFLYKPRSDADGNLVVLIPNRYNNQIDTVEIVTPDGQTLNSRFAGNTHNGQRGHFYFDRPGSRVPQGSVVQMRLDSGQVVQWRIGDTSSRNEGGAGEVISGGGGVNQSASAPGGASVGAAETGPGFAFPQADYSGLEFSPITPSFIPQIDVPFVDPLSNTQEIAGFNQQQFQQNLAQGAQNALGLTELEFTGLQAFNRQARGLQQEGITSENAFNQGQVASANEFNREQIPQANLFNQEQVGAANVFNQQQRIEQLDTALPGARSTIQRQIERGSTLAEGRFVSDAEDRAFEVAARNAAAEGTAVRGFGDDSVFGRRASDLLSAEQRLQLSQVGEQTLDRFLTLGANLAFDQPIKFNPILDQPLRFEPQQARTSQDVRGAPARPASELAVQQQQALTNLTTLDPAQAIQFEVGQNQFQANLSQRVNEFNSNLDFNAQAFNSEGSLKVDLEQLSAEVFNAQQEANAISAGIGAEQAEAGFGEGQDASTFGAIGQGLGLASTAIDIFSSLFGKGAATETGTSSAGLFSRIGEMLGIGAGSAPVSAGIGGGVGGGAAGAGAGGAVGAGVGGGAAGAGASGGASAGAVGAGPILAAINAILGIKRAKELGVFSGHQLTGEEASSILHPISGAIEAKVGLDSKIEGATGISPLEIADKLSLAFHALQGITQTFGSGKSGDQQKRDKLRDYSSNLGLFFLPDGENPTYNGLNPKSHHIELADGSFYDIGVDGANNKFQNHGVNIDGKTERHPWMVDFSDPRAPEVAGYLNPFAFMIYGNEGRRMMGHLTNAAMSNNKTLFESKDNVKHMVETAGINYETGAKILKQYHDRGSLTREDYLAFLNGWNQLMLTEGVLKEVSV